MKEGKNMLEFSIITITTCVAFLNEVTKVIADTGFNKNIDKYIPIFSLVYGLILGICGYFIGGVDMGDNIIEAIFIGLSSGAASTGGHQIGKQLSKEQ
jgi:hypothetical protein